MEHVEPDGYEMGLTDHRRSSEPKIKHSLAILQDLRPWGPCVIYLVHNWRIKRAGWRRQETRR